MKKIFRLIIACISCVAILFTVACGSSSGAKTPEGYETVDTYNEKSSEQIYTDIMDFVEENNTNFTAKTVYDIDASISVAGQTVPVDIDMVDTVSVCEGGFYEKATMTVNCPDFPGLIPDMWAEVWHVNDVAYINNPKNSGATKIKVDVNWADFCANQNLNPDDIFNPVYDFSDASFDNVKFYVDKNVKDEKDVDPYFEMEIKGDKAEEFAQKRVENLTSQVQDAKVSISTIKYKFFITEEGDLDYIGIIYTMTVKCKVQGVDVTYKYNFDGVLTLENVGTTVVAEPSDASSYVSGYLQ